MVRCQISFGTGALPIQTFHWLDAIWSKSQEQHVREGVAIADDCCVPKDLQKNLINQIDLLLESQIVDYHPHSNGIVRGIVHPTFYSYVKGVSPLLKDSTAAPEEDVIDLEAKDYWGRKYEATAKYQQLLTYFDIGLDGSCTICHYINNLVPRQKHEELYGSLSHLFSQALPLSTDIVVSCRRSMFEWKL